MCDKEGDTLAVQDLVRSIKGDHNAVVDRMRRLLEEGSWSDVQFLVGRKQTTATMFRAHRLLLACSSPVLANIVYGEQPQQQTICVADMRADTFRTLLHYIYTDELSLGNVEEAMQAMKAAAKYQLPHMSTRCGKYLVSMLTCENVCGVLEFSRNAGEQQLTDRCLQFLCLHGEAVLKHPSFLEVSPDTLQLLLDQDHLVVASEAEVVEAVIRWSAEECRRRKTPCRAEVRRQLVKDYLGKLRLLTLTADEFVGVAGLKDVLSPEEYRDVLSYLVKPDSCEVPSTICYNDSHRGFISTRRSVAKPAQCAHCLSALVTTYMGNFCKVCKKAAN